MPYVVESKAPGREGMRVWVRTEERAKELVAQGPDRSYREVKLEELPQAARQAMEQAG